MQYHKMGSVNSFTDLWKAVGLTNEGIEQDSKARVSIYQETFVGFEKQTARGRNVTYKFVGLFTVDLTRATQQPSATIRTFSQTSYLLKALTTHHVLLCIKCLGIKAHPLQHGGRSVSVPSI